MCRQERIKLAEAETQRGTFSQIHLRSKLLQIKAIIIIHFYGNDSGFPECAPIPVPEAGALCPSFVGLRALYRWNHKLPVLTVDFRHAQDRGGSPAWASIVEVKEETFCEYAFDQNIEKIKHETRLSLFNASKKMTYCKKVSCYYPPPLQRPSRTGNMTLRGKYTVYDLYSRLHTSPLLALLEPWKVVVLSSGPPCFHGVSPSRCNYSRLSTFQGSRLDYVYKVE